MNTRDARTINADTVEEVSPHNKALYDAGKSLLVESVRAGREFCRFMTTTTLSAIPIYLALLKYALPTLHEPQTQEQVFLLLPSFLFLVSSIVFILGYFPQKGNMSLDVPEEIENEINKTIRRRRCLATVAFVIFSLGVGGGGWQLIQMMLAVSPV